MDRDDDLLERRLREAYRIEPRESLRERLMAIPDTVAQRAPQPERTHAPRRGGFGWPKFAVPALPGLANFQWRLAVPAFAVAAAVAVLWVAGINTAPQSVPVAGSELTTQQQQEAIRDFVIVMNYLQAATASAHRGVQGEIGGGLLMAFNRGEQSFTELSNEVTNGG